MPPAKKIGRKRVDSRGEQLTTSLTLVAEDQEKVREIAKSRGVSVATVTREAVEKYLRELEVNAGDAFDPLSASAIQTDKELPPDVRRPLADLISALHSRLHQHASSSA